MEPFVLPRLRRRNGDAPSPWGFALVLLGGLLCAARAQSGAPDWPGTKPIRFEVVAAPGGLVDLVPRTLSNHLAASIGVPVVVEDRPGAGGNVAAALVARAEPDGHTLLVTGSNQAVNPTLLPNPGFDYERDLAPVSMLVTSKLLLVASPSFPANSITDVIALGKAKAEIGQHRDFADRHAQSPRRRNAGAVRRRRSQFRGL